MNLQGTIWRFKNQIEMPPIPTISVTNPNQEYLSGRNLFTTINNEAYKTLSVKTMIVYANGSDSADINNVYNVNGSKAWKDEAYRTITFYKNAEIEFTPNEETFLEWLTSNATQIQTTTIPKYIVPGEKIRSVADALRMKTYTTAAMTFPDGFVSTIDSIVDTTDATATAENIQKNKTAYVNGEKITGTADIIRERVVTKTWPSSERTVAADGCIKQIGVFKATDTINMKGIKSCTTSSSISLSGQVEFSYNRSIESEYIHMYFNNIGGREVTVPADAFTTTATIIY